MQIFSYVCREQIEFAYLFYGTYKVPITNHIYTLSLIGSVLNNI